MYIKKQALFVHSRTANQKKTALNRIFPQNIPAYSVMYKNDKKDNIVHKQLKI